MDFAADEGPFSCEPFGVDVQLRILERQKCGD